MMYGLKWNVLSHISPASVPCSAFPFFLFFFFRWGSTISRSKKKKTWVGSLLSDKRELFPSTVELLSSTTVTLGTEESGHCREVTVVKRLKQEWMYGQSLSAKTNNRCKEVAVVERLKQDSVYGLSAKKNGHCTEVAVGGHCGKVAVGGGSTVLRNSSECLI